MNNESLFSRKPYDPRNAYDIITTIDKELDYSFEAGVHINTEKLVETYLLPENYKQVISQYVTAVLELKETAEKNARDDSKLIRMKANSRGFASAIALGAIIGGALGAVDSYPGMFLVGVIGGFGGIIFEATTEIFSDSLYTSIMKKQSKINTKLRGVYREKAYAGLEAALHEPFNPNNDADEGVPLIEIKE